MIRLLVERPDLSPMLNAFDQPVVVVGRGGGDPVDWTLPFADVSRVQCRFTSGGDAVFVEPLSERNATFLNRNRLTGIARVQIGDEIRFGKCTVRVVGSETKAAAPVQVQAPVQSVEEPVKVAAPRRAAARPVEMFKSRGEPVAPTPAAAAGPAREETGRIVAPDMAPIVEQAQGWELRGQPRSLLLRGDALRRGRQWLAGGRELGERGALVRKFVEASVRRRWGDRWRVAQGIGLIAAAALGGSATASVLLPDLTVPEVDAGDGASHECDPKALERADLLVTRAEAEPEGAAVLLGMSYALRIADNGRCRHLARAEPALRGQLAARRARVLGQVDGPVQKVVARADGRYVASIDAKGAVRIWDVHGQRGAQPLAESSGEMKVLAWSGDYRWLATGGADPEVVIWDTKQFPQIERRQTLAHRGEIAALAFSADGSLLASADRRGALRLWDMGGEASGTQLGEVQGLVGITEQLVFDESAKRLVARVGGQVHVLSIAPPGAAPRLGKPTTLVADAPVTTVAMNLSGSTIYTGDRAGQVFEWKQGKRGWQAETITTHGDQVVAVQEVSARKSVLSVAADRSLKLVGAKLRAGSPRLTHVPSPLREPPRFLAVDPSGKRALTVGVGEAPEIWDIVARRADRLASLDEQRSPVTAMAMAAEQSAVVTGAADGTLRVWDLLVDGGSAGAHTLTDHQSTIDAMVLSHQGDTLVSVGRDQRLRVWKLDHHGVPSPLRVIVPDRAVQQVAVSDDGRWIAATSAGLLIVWSTVDAELKIERAAHGDEIRRVAFSRGGDWLVSADRGGDVLAWRMQPTGPAEGEPRRTALGAGITALAVSDEQVAVAVPSADGAQVLAWPVGEVGGSTAQLWRHAVPVTALTFDANGRMLASGGADGRVNTGQWGEGRFQPTEAYSLGESVGALGFTRGADEKVFLALGGDGGSVAVYEPLVRGGKVRRFEAHKGAISGVGFGASPRELLTAGRDGALLLWHLTPAGESKVALTGHVDAIVEFQVDAAGKVAVTAGADQTLRVWPLEVEGLTRVVCGVAGRELSGDEWSRLMPERADLKKLCDDSL